MNIILLRGPDLWYVIYVRTSKLLDLLPNHTHLTDNITDKIERKGLRDTWKVC